MANLIEIAELAWRQLFPNPTAQTATKKAEFIATAKLEYAWNLWRISKETGRADGEWEVPSALWREGEIEVNEKIADISHLPIFRSFEGDVWIGSIGGFGCECSYTRQSLNLSKILCDEEYHGNSKPYTVFGDKIAFPSGAHRNKMSIIYASNGEDLSGEILVDDAVGGLIRTRLVEIYAPKQVVDVTNNNNPNQ